MKRKQRQTNDDGRRYSFQTQPAIQIIHNMVLENILQFVTS